MMHLLLPLLASVLFAASMIFTKRASAAGVRPLTYLFVSNVFAASMFSFVWLLGGPGQPITMMWQPAVMAMLYLLGLSLTFLAVQRGDVSVATPIFGAKVVLVALLVTFIGQSPPTPIVWLAALLATLGIGLIQWTGRNQPKHVLLTIVLALSAAGSYAMFDVLVQRWSPAWGAGRFLPIVYWLVALASLAMIPWVQWDELKRWQVLKFLLPGAALIALQAVCIVGAIALFGDVARVNIVLSLRGLWGVIFAWFVAGIWGGEEADRSRGTMLTRLAGATILTASVILAILDER